MHILHTVLCTFAGKKQYVSILNREALLVANAEPVLKFSLNRTSRTICSSAYYTITVEFMTPRLRLDVRQKFQFSVAGKPS